MGITALLLEVVLASTMQVDLDLVPLVDSVLPGTIVDVALIASADGPESIVTVEAILQWDPSRLELIGATVGTIPFFVEGFLPDPDGINTDLTDGDAVYTVLTPLGSSQPVPPDVLVAVFHVKVLTSGCLALPADLGGLVTTRVLTFGQGDITGALSAPVGFEALPGAWTDLGLGLAGTGALTPTLVGEGILLDCDDVTLTLGDALPNTSSFLVIGFSFLGASLKGGVLVPTPNFVITLPTGPLGAWSVSAPWLSGIPPGISFWLQTWTSDPGGPKGFAATNGLQATTP